MKLTILGCSGSVPGPGNPASGYLVESGDTRIALDLGNGTFGALQRHLDPFDLDAVLLSHLHPDHCADFAALTVFRRYHPAKPHDTAERRLPVFAPAEAPSRLAALYAPSARELAETDLTDVYDFSAHSGEPARIGPFEIHAVPLDHVCEGWGLRIAADDRVLAYTGDTGPCDGLGELAQGADVLLSEASWPDSPDAPPGIHLSGRQAAEAAKGGGVGRLLLTHLQPWTDPEVILAEARDGFDGPVELVEAGREYTV
ncbi:ribonuclease BN (tRNA processing enzyme) [Saccharopolyspora erythraea NRRL 2338]|uniref:Beta-lactamase-like n=2 Tax=Saccharopolyspora erythraea TaxID=1836 RepID=A4F911_SACEN|nr:MBL fold metallo-hydrolase [Saccharopolyspora erythraea]EQD87211.1 beta-lactamase [Saccharopolyspora erythraea D]PFG94329.1 ribonuclease BN (tRNA processing enzyme) [Saccharopolyspora erythraea NRRL 2338]QRK91100.1 MBL fold metallo-hydrolase [Saccharopolyspora erythraea]CAM00536.1 beta-lactamase-like [Saccharopolyspora erythraea NRRL 2338]